MTPAPTRKCLRLVMSFPSDSTPRGPALRAREQALEPETDLQPESDLEESSHLDPSYVSPSDLSPSPDLSSPDISSPGLSSPGLSSSPDSAPHLAFAPVALAQYHDIAEKLASNNIFRILRSPAPVRVWVYRALLAETRAWDKWNREAIEGVREEYLGVREEYEGNSSSCEGNSSSCEGNTSSHSGNRSSHLGNSSSHSLPAMDRHDASLDDPDDLESVSRDSDFDADTDAAIHARPYLTRLRLALAPYTVHFRNPGYVRDETLRMLERDVVKKTLEDSRKRIELREELGLAWEFWDDLAGVLKAAIPSLEKRCFAQPDPAAPEYEGLSGPLIASHSPSLLRDLERLNQLVCIARNVLVHGERVQNLSAERLFDKDIFNLINVCVRVTARGYDGEAGTQDEDKWQGVINACECREYNA